MTLRVSMDDARPRAASVRRASGVHRLLAGVLAIGLAAVALIALLAPVLWYAALPGVASSAPLDGHVSRDLGCAYLVIAVVLLALVVGRRAPTSALVAAAAFLVLHAGLHLCDLFIADRGASAGVFQDMLIVYLPAVVTAWLSLGACARRLDNTARVARQGPRSA